MKTRLSQVLFLLVLFSASGLLQAIGSGNPTLEARVWEAKKVISEVMATPDQSIPEELLAKCKAIAIYPSVLKGGFIFGARYGRGVVLKRDEKTGLWGPVAFSTIGGGSWGLQIGGQATGLILVFFN